MIRSIKGRLSEKEGHAAVLEVGGVGFRVFTTTRTLSTLPGVGGEVFLCCHLHVKEDALELYGFARPEELVFFEQLISVNGVGPKSALSVMDVTDFSSLASAVKEGRVDLLTRASGIGRKTAERIILELKGKVVAKESRETVRSMETDMDLLEALLALGYRKGEAESALQKIKPGIEGVELRLKEALKILGKRMP